MSLRAILITLDHEQFLAQAQEVHVDMAGTTLALEVAQKCVSNGFVSRDIARATLKALEDETRAMYPHVFVVRASMEI